MSHAHVGVDVSGVCSSSALFIQGNKEVRKGWW